MHELLHASYAELLSVFCHYCKQGGADGAGVGWRSMDEAEWSAMVRDLEAGDHAPPARGGRGAVTIASSRVFAHVRGPKAKDIGLVKYFQLVATYAFVRYNMWFDPAAAAAAHAASSADGDTPQLLESRGDEIVPLPMALRSLLQAQLLPYARRDEALDLRKEIYSDRQLRELLGQQTQTVQSLFVEAGGTLPPPGGGAVGAKVSLKIGRASCRERV